MMDKCDHSIRMINESYGSYDNKSGVREMNYRARQVCMCMCVCVSQVSRVLVHGELNKERKERKERYRDSL